MEILVFKTNLVHHDQIQKISPLLNDHPGIEQWNVDGHDIDNVLRIVTRSPIPPAQVAQLVRDAGFFCEELPG